MGVTVPLFIESHVSVMCFSNTIFDYTTFSDSTIR